ncbi:MAG: CYTH domain-containing protein, partial [Desulfurococcales archaeon]|nr:CYTH domain-containing protein [Desulfurococcales archaeon]
MYEKEVKIKVECNAIENLVRILEENGAKKVRVQDEVDVYYQHPCRNFLETDEAVRLRIVDGKTESITYKGQRIQESNGVK